MKNEELYFEKSFAGSMVDVRGRVEAAFKDAGFGVLTEISMHEKFEDKLDIKIDPYVILGICNPKFAYEAYKLDENIGVLLPCKILLKQKSINSIQVLVLNPALPMAVLGNENLTKLADEVTGVLRVALENV